MATHNENHTISEARQLELATKHQRPQVEVGRNKVNQPTELLTVGFTIESCTSLIGQSLSDPAVLGWFVHLAGGNVPHTNIDQITLSELYLYQIGTTNKLGLTTRNLLKEDGEQPEIRPKVVFQARNPVVDPSMRTSTGVDYALAESRTSPTFLNDDTLEITDFSQHESWARAVFFRRSDLRYLRILMLSNPVKYNDVFFSGAKVNYDTMHNPPLRVMQLTLSGVLDSSIAFTLKAEPFVNEVLATGTDNNEVPHPDLDLGGNLIGLNGRIRTNTSTNSAQGADFPAVAFGIQCPDYWDIITEVEGILSAESIEAAAHIADIQGTLDDLLDAASQGNVPSINSTPVLSLDDFPGANVDGIITTPNNIIYQLLTGLINAITNLRALLFP